MTVSVARPVLRGLDLAELKFGNDDDLLILSHHPMDVDGSVFS